MSLPLRLPAAALALLAGSAAAQNPLELLLQQPSHYWFTVESVTTESKWLEAADDLDLVADVHRVRAHGHPCWQCEPGDLLSARLAFYEWTADGPGALQAEYVFADGDPGLTYTEGPGLIDFTLETPFVATGKHFLSVQVEVEGIWPWWASNFGQPNGAPVYSRTEPGGEWSRHEITYPAGPADADLSFDVYGVDDTPPTAGTDPCGDWTVVATPKPVDGVSVYLRDVVAVAADDVWAVGSYSQVTPPFQFDTFAWAQHWDGEQWTHVPTPQPVPYPGGGYLTLYAVDAVASDDVWAAGSFNTANPNGGWMGSQILVIHWDGTEWTQIEPPYSPTGGGPFVHDIEVIAEDDIWFFGQWLDVQLSALGEQRSLAMHWDGSSLEVIDTPFFDNDGGYGGGHSLVRGSALASDDVWAVGGAHGPDFTTHSYIVHWDGSSWEHVPGPTPGLDNRLYAVEAIAPDDVWASGFYTAPTGARIPLFLHWDGSSWTQVDSPGGGTALLHRPGAGDILSSAGIYGGEGVFRWDGVSWEPVMDFPTSTDPLIDSLALVPGTDCEVWGVGRQNGPDVGGLTVHLEPHANQAAIAAVEPCDPAAPVNSLAASPLPELGLHVSFAADASATSTSPGSVVLLGLSPGAPDGCGLVVPGFGEGAADGEFLLLGGDIFWLPLAVWGGPGTQAVFDAPVPTGTALVGLDLAAQALFYDPGVEDVVVSRGLVLTIGE